MRKHFMPATCELDPEPYWDEVHCSRWSFEKQIEDNFSLTWGYICFQLLSLDWCQNDDDYLGIRFSATIMLRIFGRPPPLRAFDIIIIIIMITSITIVTLWKAGWYIYELDSREDHWKAGEGRCLRTWPSSLLSSSPPSPSSLLSTPLSSSSSSSF